MKKVKGKRSKEKGERIKEKNFQRVERKGCKVLGPRYSAHGAGSKTEDRKERVYGLRYLVVRPIAGLHFKISL